jgi:hypothetical protein
MPIILNKELYEIAKKTADKIYKKPSAYKSGFIVKLYKHLGGKYADDGKTRNLKRWYLERWYDVGHKSYPVFRPSFRINKYTPLTVEEIDRKNLQQQIKLKQKIKGNKNLPPFIKKKRGRA